jgi:hypothetical protein
MMRAVRDERVPRRDLLRRSVNRLFTPTRDEIEKEVLEADPALRK